MNESEREAFYDTEIAPALLRLANKCADNGLSFLASVEWAPGESGRTRKFVEPFGISMDLADAMFRANGNIDSFMIYLMKRARKVGHSSAVLHQLGVAPEPEAHEGS